MKWTVVSFGKHKGKTLPQIIFDDADWFFWGYEKGAFKGSLAREASEVYRRARSIKVPQRNGQRTLIEYVIDEPTGKFGTMRLISYSPYLHGLDVDSVIDFYKPRTYAGYDKMGYKNLMYAFKASFYGNGSRRLSKKDREQFFSDDRNFELH